MATHFFDSSAIAKRYINEIGTAWVNGILAPATGNQIYLARITGVEVVSALSRRRRGGSISVTGAATLLAQFRHEFGNEYRMVEIGPLLVSHAMNLAEVHPLRAFDAIQLAAALQVQAHCLRLGLPFVMVSADTALNAAAAAEGLTVDDPNNHP